MYKWAENHIKLDSVLKAMKKRSFELKQKFEPTEEEVMAEYVRYGGRIVTKTEQVKDKDGKVLSENVHFVDNKTSEEGLTKAFEDVLGKKKK